MVIDHSGPDLSSVSDTSNSRSFVLLETLYCIINVVGLKKKISSKVALIIN